MIRMAICDDQEQAVALHGQIARKALAQLGVGCEITPYTQSANLLWDISDDHFFYDLILLDIEMPGLNGMEMAGRIREFLPKVRIIFVTSHMQYAIDAFELSIFRYVPKGELEERLAAAVTDAAKLIQLENQGTYTIHTNSRLERIPLGDICCVRREGRGAAIVTSRGVSRVRKSLQQVYGELSAPEFIFIDRGCIVNILQVMKVSGGVALLKSGEQLPISRAHLQQVKEQINRFWGERI